MRIKPDFSKTAHWIAGAACLAFFGVLWLFLHLKHVNFNNASHIYENILHAFVSGSYTYNMNDFERPISVFGYHCYPIAFIFGLLLKVTGSFYAMLIVQAAAVASAAFAVFLSARKVLNNAGIALFFPVLFMGYFLTLHASTWSVNLNVISAAFTAWALYFMLLERFPAGLCLFLLALSCGENNAPFVTGAGLYLLACRKWKWGAVIGLAGILYFLAATKIALIANKGEYLYGPEKDNLVMLLVHPLQGIKDILLSRDNPETLLRLLYPLAFLPLFAPLKFVFLFCPTAVRRRRSSSM